MAAALRTVELDVASSGGDSSQGTLRHTKGKLHRRECKGSWSQ